MTIAFGVVALLDSWLADRRRATRVVLDVLLAVAAVALLVWVVLTGDAGARRLGLTDVSSVRRLAPSLQQPTEGLGTVRVGLPSCTATSSPHSGSSSPCDAAAQAVLGHLVGSGNASMRCSGCVGEPEGADAGRVDDPGLEVGDLEQVRRRRVCRPRPVTTLTTRRPAGVRRRALTSVDFPTRSGPSRTLVRPRSRSRSSSRSPPLWVTAQGTPRAVGRQQGLRVGQVGLGQAQQQLEPGVERGDQRAVDQPRLRSGSASAVTTTSWSAFATITRSTGSSSSAVRRSTVARSTTSTMRARAPSRPEVSPTTRTRSPTTTPLRPRAGLHGQHGPLVDQRGEAATVDRDDDPVDRVVVGQALPLVRGRVRRRGRS